MAGRAVLALVMLATCIFTTQAARNTTMFDCPDDVAPACKNAKKCRLYDGSDKVVCNRCKNGYTRNPDNGECVECNVPGCGQCKSANKCSSCKDGQMLAADRTCASKACPAGCQECAAEDGACAKCWPCGRRYRSVLGDTLESVAARCGVSPADLTSANPTTLSGVGADDHLGDNRVLKVPPIACPGAPPTGSGGGGGSNGPSTVPTCPDGTFWMSCFGSIYCPQVTDPASGDVRTYGCVSAETCLSLYDDCVEASPDCPNCCFSRSCAPGGARPETWYFMTFADGSAHCDPWGRWYG